MYVKFFRLISAIVALLMLASCAAGGASETTQTTDSSVSESPVMTDTIAANVPNLPDADYGGHNFHVLLQVAGYYELMLQSKYLRDEESIEMMDQYIYSNIGFTPYICSSTLISTIKTLITGKSEVASLLESKRKTIEKEIEKYVSLFSETNH